MASSSLETTDTVEDRTERYTRAAALLRRWLDEAESEDEADYDWPAIDAELRDSAMRCREPDAEGGQSR